MGFGPALQPPLQRTLVPRTPEPSHVSLQAGFGDPRLANAAIRHFGSWAEAVEAADLTDLVLSKTYRKWSRAAILAEIRRRLAAGESLSSGRRENQRLAHAARRHFGSWSAALLAAGVTPKPGRPRKQK